MSAVSTAQTMRVIKSRPKTYVPPPSKQVNPVMLASEPTTAPPLMTGGNIKDVGRAIRKGTRKAVREVAKARKPVARVVAKSARPLGMVAGLAGEVAGLIPDERAQAVSKGLKVASKTAPIVEKGAELAGRGRGRPRKIPASIGQASIAMAGGRMMMKGQKAILMKK